MAACSPRRVRAPTPRAISRRSTVPSLPDGGQRPGRTTSRWARRSASSPRFPTDRFCRTRNQSGSLLSTVPEAPSAEQLLALLAERDAMTVELAGGWRSWKRGWASTRRTPRSRRAPVGTPNLNRGRLRRASGRQPGKQPGERGFGLKQRADPDQTVVHIPRVCRGCGSDLAQPPVVGNDRTDLVRTGWRRSAPTCWAVSTCWWSGARSAWRTVSVRRSRLAGVATAEDCDGHCWGAAGSQRDRCRRRAVSAWPPTSRQLRQ